MSRLARIRRASFCTLSLTHSPNTITYTIEFLFHPFHKLRNAIRVKRESNALNYPLVPPPTLFFISLFCLIFLFSVSDASGRYSSQFHFGNGFWLGSSTLCKELNVTEKNGVARADKDQLPFPLRFHVARLYLDLPKEVDFSVS